MILDYYLGLYDQYSEELNEVRQEQRKFWYRLSAAQYDDIESEILYMLVRENPPLHFLEIGALAGWSTSWVLKGIDKNEKGKIHSFDLRQPDFEHKNCLFTQGDVRKTLFTNNSFNPIQEADFLFIDAEHTHDFHVGCIDELIKPLKETGRKIPVIVHDVFINSSTPHDSATCIIDYLKKENINYFSPSSGFIDNFNTINNKRKELIIDSEDNIHPKSEKNPSLIFYLNNE